MTFFYQTCYNALRDVVETLDVISMPISNKTCFNVLRFHWHRVSRTLENIHGVLTLLWSILCQAPVTTLKKHVSTRSAALARLVG